MRGLGGGGDWEVGEVFEGGEFKHRWPTLT